MDFTGLMETTTITQARAEADRKHRQKREALAQEQAKLEARDAAERPALAAKVRAAERAVQTAEGALKNAKSDLLSASHTLTAHDQQVNTARNRNEAQLLAAAGDELPTFLARTGAERERLADHLHSIVERLELVTVGYSIAVGPVRKVLTVDNREQIGARIARLAEIEREAHRLAATKTEFAADLDALWNSLPDAALRD